MMVLDEIRSMLTSYFDVLQTQDLDLFDQVFHPEAVLYSAQDGQVVVRPIADYRNIVQGRAAPAEGNFPRLDEVLNIDIMSPEMAWVKVRLRLFDNTMVDYLNLLKVDGRWTIAAKFYHRN